MADGGEPKVKLIRAAGILFVAEDGQVLLMRRTDTSPGVWALPGGRLEGDESAEEAARRELREETGVDYSGPLTEWTRRIADGVDFTTFLGAATIKHAPTLNEEHDLYTWASPDAAKTLPLHPGMSIVLDRFEMNELDVARAIVSGDLVSPQRYGNMLLVALRITGTGISYRPAYKEFVWREPSVWLSEDAVARCAGLPVVLEHPPRKMLNTAEFKKRSVGSIMLPYVQGDELWGIARIQDDPMAQMLELTQLSTSPGVVFRPRDGNVYHIAEDGRKLLIEGEPSLLDHLAICELGVWDKGGPAAGVLNQILSEENAMAEEKKDAVRADEALDKVLSSFDAFSEKMDACMKRMDAMEAKEKARDDAAKADSAKADAAKADAAKEEKEREDAAKADAAKADAAKADAAKLDAAKDDSAKTDAARHDATIKALNDTLAKLSSLEESHRALAARTTEPAAEELPKFVDAQRRADRAFRAFGDSAGAPRWVNGQSLQNYRIELANKVKGHSATYKDADLSKIGDATAFGAIEGQIYADAVDAAISTNSIGVGLLREVKDPDVSGRQISRFYGDPEACWAPFKLPAQRVTGVRRNFH